MTTRRDAGAPTTGSARERDHLATLGLEPGASAGQIADAHAELIAYLATAPRAVRPWARRRVAEVEAAYGFLGRSTQRQAGAPAASGVAGTRYIATDAEDAEELLDALDDSGRGAPSRRIPRQVNRLSVEAHPSTGFAMPRDPLVRRLALGLGAATVVAVAVFAVYKLGDPAVPGLTGTPVPAATAPGLDQARVGALMEKIAANPRDVASLRELADLYYAAGDNQASRTFLLKVLAVDPKNIEALLGSGATAYNLDDFKAAEEAWRAVLAIDPKNIDAYYDLGLMYFSMDPPDLVRMREAWSKVVELAPDSQLASIVKTHMPDPSPSLGTSPVPSGAPASGAPASGAPASGAPASPAPTTPAPTTPAATPAPSPS